MNQGKRKYSIPSPEAAPVPVHTGWGRMGWATGGQPTEQHGGDQVRFQGENRVILSTEPTVLMDDGSIGRQCLTSSLEQRNDNRAPRVFIGHNEDVAMAATLDEARRFAIGILALVDGLQD